LLNECLKLLLSDQQKTWLDERGKHDADELRRCWECNANFEIFGVTLTLVLVSLKSNGASAAHYELNADAFNS